MAPMLLPEASGRAPFGGPVPEGVEVWTPSRLSIDPWLVLRLTGYRRRDEVVPPIWEAAVGVAARAETLATPRAALRAVRVAAAGPDGVQLAEGARFSGGSVGRLLAGCPLAIVFALTLGPALGREVAALGDRRELLEAHLLDTAGWAALEVAIRALRLDLRASVRDRGWRLTHRLGPGHRDWPIGEHAVLLGLLGDIGGLVGLSSHGLLVPFKSITGVFGIHRE